jgi:PDZ domain-containing protein
MTQRTTAGLTAVLLLAAIVAWTVFRPLPYVTYEPGQTIDVLGEANGKEIIEVSGHKVYRDPGELRMTTVLVSTPNARLDLFTLMSDWFNPDDAVYPYESVYAPDVDEQENDEQGQVEMITSQDAAAAAALRELGFEVEPVIEVAAVTDGTPAEGKLKVRDVLIEVGGIPVKSAEDVARAVTGAAEGEAVEFVVRRGGKKGKTVRTSITPTMIDGTQRVGIRIGTGFDLPFHVRVNIDESIGGPSAGLMFSLAIYDTLTPGSLTGGQAVAGTGTIDEEGRVGPIGGIQQKIVGAREAGAQLFLVPPDNCSDALDADNESMHLVRAVTMHAAVRAIEKWVKNPDAKLPACTDDTTQEATG